MIQQRIERVIQASPIHIGTSGWSYPKGEGTWQDYFYPKGTRDELEYYSHYFNTVEINSSFYRPPDRKLTQSWARRVPQGFIFTAKLWQKFTHPKMYKEATGQKAAISQADVDLFRSGIDPLASQNKLGALLAQFPPSFTNDSYSRQILHDLIEAFASYRLAIELRHKSWSDDPATAIMFNENNVSWVRIDEPKFRFSLATDIPLTSDVVYFRFHGRSRETWWDGDNETRYKYLYSPDEINELARNVETAVAQSKLSFAFFNNHWQAYAPRNAIDLQRALNIPDKDLPEMWTGLVS